VTAVIVFIAAVAGFAVWFIRKRRAGATRYKILPKFGDQDPDDEDEEDNEGGRGGLLPVYDTRLTEEDDPALAAELESRARERDSQPTVVSPSPLNIQGDDGAPVFTAIVPPIVGGSGRNSPLVDM